MKIKGISAAEQHVEKIVLGAVSLVFLAVLAMQFLLQPNKVQVGRGEPVPPADAFAAVETKATELREAMKPKDVAAPDVPVVNLLEQFKAQRSEPVSPRRVIVDMGRPLPIQGSRESGGSTNTPLATVAVPAPSRPVADAFWSSIDPGEVIATPDLKKLVPAQQPFDKLGISVEVHFDGTAFGKALLNDPDGDGPTRAVPNSWYRDIVQVIGVNLERQELGADGKWANPTAVKPMPGRIDLVAESAGLRPSDMPSLLNDARTLADEIQRPPYYRTVAGPAWVPPAEARAMDKTAVRTPEQEKDYARLTALQAEIDKLQDAIAKAKSEKPDGERGGAPPRGPGGGGGKRGGQPGGDQDPEKERLRIEKEQKDRDRKIADLEKRLKAKEDDAKAIEDRLAIPGSVTPGTATPGARPKPLLENPDIRLWAHDVTAEPGKTYRYRATISFNNPVFGKGASLVPEQQTLAEQPFIASAASEWSEPIEALGESYYFIVSASEASQFGPPRAAAKLYKMYYGYYREGSTTVEPGDALAADLKLPDPNRLPIFDLAKITGAQPTPDVPPPPPDRDGGGRRPGSDAGEGILVPPGGRDPGSRPTEGGEDPAALAKLPPNAVPGPKSLGVAIPVVLLDVARTPSVAETGLGGGKEQTEAYMRSQAGLIVIRNPDIDRMDALFKRIQKSVQEGETQGTPAPQVSKPNGPRPPVRPKPNDKPKPDDGPPGGGGGGG